MSQLQRPRIGPWIQIGSPRGFEWNSLDLPLTSVPTSLDGFRIIHLSDLHLRRHWLPEYNELISRIDERRADLVLVTGDVIEHRSSPGPVFSIVERFLSGLRARLGVHVILGNHDGDLVGPYVKQSGTNLMNGRYARLDSLELIGLPGVHRRDLRRGFLQSIPPRDPTVPRIVMSHYPDDIRRIGSLQADLVLSGHTHGGQICLPGGKPIIRHTSLKRDMCSGLHRFGDTWLLVNRGFGFAKMRLRLFCPAEVIEINLRHQPATLHAAADSAILP